MLEEHCHKVGDQDDAEQQVAKLRPACEVGRPVAWIHIADCHHQAWASKSQEFAPALPTLGYRNRGVNFGQRERCLGM